ncbi:MAG TPA: YbjQ family protein, partial [Ignavibacteriaceae bacterium]
MGTYYNFILSTTPTLEGYKIKKYYGTVTSHVVAGTGLFSDFAAGMSDVFGGRSESYQKQLISIKEEVLKRLKEEATSLGANGIVGLKVDFDEISGKTKSMFMVSALGTAVQLEFNGNKEESDLQISRITQVTSDILNLEIEKQELINSFSISTYKPSKENWEYITENAITEVFNQV